MSNLPQSTQFRDNILALAPPWLNSGNSQKYLYTLGLCSDLLLDKMDQAVKIRMPGQGDVTQIPYLANDRVLVQGPAEPNDAFLLRLKNAFAAWKKAGSRVAVLEQLQAYFEGLQPGVVATMPEMTIVGGNSTYTTWSQQYQGDAIGAPPTLTRTAANFNWDGTYPPWRSWLILFMSLVPTGQSGTLGQFSNVGFPGDITPPGMLGSGATAGVWVPATSGANLPSSYVDVIDLTGIVAGNLQQWITISGSSNPGNNGTFQIVAINSVTSVQIALPGVINPDTGPLTWSISSYPFIGPGPTWGSPGYTFGNGELTIPPIDTGSNVGGVWQPTTSGATYGTTISWGLNCAPTTLQSIRQILQRWKSATTYYPNIIVAFDGADGTAGSAYSPNSSEGSGNPDGTFGAHGHNVNGVWVPNRLITSPYDAYCQGTGTWHQCSVQNVT